MGALEMATPAYVDLMADGCVIADDFAIETNERATTVTSPNVANDNVLLRYIILFLLGDLPAQPRMRAHR